MEDSTTSKPISLWKIVRGFMLQDVPAYANKIYYSMGFLSATSLVFLILSGIVMVFFGPYWWLTTSVGLFVRSLHLWSAQAFIFFILLHVVVVFLTSGFKGPRRRTWVIGSLMLFAAIFEAEFGYGLRGDFSSQWRALQASDLYNGSGLGAFINNLNSAQIYGIHIILIPLIILGLLFLHYTLIRTLGIAPPYKKEVSPRIAPSNHNILFVRGGVLVGVLMLLAIVLPSPLIIPTTIQSVAQDSPSLVAQTLLQEMNHTSGTATYMDGIDPYTYDTQTIYITTPYRQYIQTTGQQDMLAVFFALSPTQQQQDIATTQNNISASGDAYENATTTHPIAMVIGTLVRIAQSGLYESILNQGQTSTFNHTYVDRFLSDTGVLEAHAQNLGITTDQYGMVREESGGAPGAWWLAPVGLLDHTLLATDPNQDRDGAEILGLLMLLLVAFPYIPGLNKLPEKLHLAPFFWK